MLSIVGCFAFRLLIILARKQLTASLPCPTSSLTMTNDSVVVLLSIYAHPVNIVTYAGSSATNVVFSEVDLNYNVAAIHCFLFIFEAFCLLALSKHTCAFWRRFYFTYNSLTVPLFTLDYVFLIAFNIVPNLKNACKLETQVSVKKLPRSRRNLSIMPCSNT